MPQAPDCENMDLPDCSEKLAEAEKILKECFQRFRIEEVFLSFNGGKDCTALLDITINVLKQTNTQENIAKSFKVVYIRTDGPFDEIESFVKEIEQHYGIKIKIEDGDLKSTLEKLLKEDRRLKACLMGTRRTDPYSSNLAHMQYTDSNWPKLMRVSPLLDWSYHEIWSYILQRNVPYCSLYDKGYTSIGSITNTWPNPALACLENGGKLRYQPAWKLPDGALERAGRGKEAPQIIVNGSHCGDNSGTSLCSCVH